MATKKTGHDTTETGISQAAEIVADAASGAIDSLRDRLAEVLSEMDGLRRQKSADDATHAKEVGRLNDIVTSLQMRVHSPHGKTLTLNEPANCLEMIIEKLHAVAIGGDARILRQTVHSVAVDLDNDGKMKLREFIQRMRSAAEAVEQESATILL